MENTIGGTMEDNTSGWAVGWAYFAAFMLMLGGFFQAVVGLVGVLEDDFYVAATNYVFAFDTTTWGWAHLALGIVLVLAAAGILVGNLAGRIVGVAVAGLSALANFAFLPIYPMWSIALIAIDIAVIWALTAHGRDITATA